jgi:hypothetical protein
VRGRTEPPVLVLPAADPAAFLERHSAAHGPHLANVAAIAREVRLQRLPVQSTTGVPRSCGRCSAVPEPCQLHGALRVTRRRWRCPGGDRLSLLPLAARQSYPCRAQPRDGPARAAQDFQEFEALDSGEWEALPGGARWHLALRAPGAASLALLFRRARAQPALACPSTGSHKGRARWLGRPAWAPAGPFMATHCVHWHGSDWLPDTAPVVCARADETLREELFRTLDMSSCHSREVRQGG